MSSSSSSFSALTPGNKFAVLGEQPHENDVASEPTTGSAKSPKSKWDKFEDDDLTDCELPEDKGKVPLVEAEATEQTRANPTSTYTSITEDVPKNLQHKEFPGNATVYSKGFFAMTPLKRREGVDILSVIFGTKPTIPAENQNAGRPMPEASTIELCRRRKATWKLNVPQKEAVNQSFNSPTGLTLIYGPPGTGKTRTATVAAYEHCLADHGVMFTCSSSKATDISLASFLEVMKKAESSTAAKSITQFESFKAPRSRKIIAVRFLGGHKFAMMDTEEDITSPTVLAVAKANPNTLFHVQLGNAIQRWAEAEEHEMKYTAHQYQTAVTKVKESTSTLLSDTRENLVLLEESLAGHFLKHEVDAIFSTCSSVSHPTIQASFKPDVSFIDEASKVTRADVCMALDPFKESIKWLIMSGDDGQSMPVITTKTANEATSILGEPLFRQLCTDPDERFPRVMLKSQYRQHKELADWPNKAFYKGTLETHPSASQGTPLQKTLKQFFSNLGGAMRHPGSIRIAVDVSNAKAVSHKYLTTTSDCNNEEARVLVGLIEKLLAYTPVFNEKDKNKFAKVSPSDIGIITPFKGQQRLIRDYLKASNIDPVQVNALLESIHTTWGMAGGEANILFISLCSRVPGNVMANISTVASPNALCMQNTRARIFEVTHGDFRDCCEAIAQPRRVKGIQKDHYYDAFRSLVEDMYSKGDIVSSSDIDAALLSEPAQAQRPTTSKFYKQVPTILSAKRKNPPSASHHHQEVRSDKKSGTAFEMRQLQKEVPTVSNPPSKRQARLAVKTARRAEREKAAAAAAAEGSAGSSIETPASEPTDDLL
jgi:DNA polymerase III delta prime subunit